MPPSPPALIAGHHHATLLTPDGEILRLSGAALTAALRDIPPPLVVHAPMVRKRLNLHGIALRDLLELFAFVMPARSTPPTPRGLALALDLPLPEDAQAEAILLPQIGTLLLRRLQAGRTLPINRHAAGIAKRMEHAGWEWAPPVLMALGEIKNFQPDGFKVWQFLPQWREAAPLPPPSSLPVAPEEARARLQSLLGEASEQRQGQSDYAASASVAFAPRIAQGEPHLVLAEAGTGTGKTLGYIAPASLWAERNHAPVWISTFTRHLQRQIDSELARLYPDPLTRREKVVVRKGRENYLCLLNYEDVLQPVLGGTSGVTIPLGLIARWAMLTADGDLAGGDLPGWFSELFGAQLLASLADRRGECIHGACRHYTRCFVEHTIRRARTADLVVANHALVMTQAALGGLDDALVPTRYVFDEGHHLFEAADSAFAAEFSGREGAELRRWLLGAEGGRSRARGIRARIGDLVAGDKKLEATLDALMHAAAALPRADWMNNAHAMPDLAGATPNPSHGFLEAVRAQVLARAPVAKSSEAIAGVLECDLFPPNDALVEAAPALARAFERLRTPARILLKGLAEKLESEADEMDSTLRERIEAVLRSLQRRLLDPLKIWSQMLAAITSPAPELGEVSRFIRFLRLDREGKLDRDAVYACHYLDPTLPFTQSLAAPAHGVLITSATLRDAGGMGDDDEEAAWEAAEARVGAPHLPITPHRAALSSPFDYAKQTRCFVVNDVSPDIPSLAGAYKALFIAAGGGGLGLFTAISRLRAVHHKIAPELEKHGISLFSQHVDAMDNATLVDVFRTEIHSCLLGTDAMRDGVDVPGKALRLVVFEKVPWPRPDILHRERRLHLAGGDMAGYDERIARLRLRQAFGRLIRSASDTGVFVLLDRRTPSRLLSAFPPGVEVRRLGLAAVAAEISTFLGVAPPETGSGA